MSIHINRSIHQIGVFRMIRFCFPCIACLIISCSSADGRLNFETLSRTYSENRKDSLKLEALQFIKENIDDQLSDAPVFYRKGSDEPVNIRLDTITGEESLVNIIKGHHLQVRRGRVPDTSILTNYVLDKEISNAVNSWNKYPWSNHVPKDIFLNYLLPYKVYGEYPQDWRYYFKNWYAPFVEDKLETLKDGLHHPRIMDPNAIYYWTVVDDELKWFSYSSNFLRLCQHPSFRELMASRRGDCYRLSYLQAYMLRSLGIPAAVDVVTLWGWRNGGHSSEVFWQGDRMRTANGKTFNRPAKVIRMSYKKQHLWEDSIRPMVHGYPFMLPDLENSHWLDVTGEHARVTDVVYDLPGTGDWPFAYICVYNYGRWVPLYYGKVSNRRKALFRNMGTDMLYRFAVPDKKEGFLMVGDILLLDSVGTARHLQIDRGGKEILRLRKINTGSASKVQKDTAYTLCYWDDKIVSWQKLSTRTCVTDSLIEFNDVPSNTFYRLIASDGKTGLERIFTYEKDRQVWW